MDDRDSSHAARGAELLELASRSDSAVRYAALEAVRELPRAWQTRLAATLVNDENAFVRELAVRLLEGGTWTPTRSVRGVVHEFDQVVHGARLTLKQRSDLIRLFQDAQQAGSFGYLGLVADRAARLVTDALSAEPAGQVTFVEQLARFLEHVASYARPLHVPADREDISLIIADVVERAPIDVVVAKLVDGAINRYAARLVLDELLQNASDAGATRLQLQTEQQDGHLLLRARNNGPSLDQETMDQLFQPWFTTRPGRAGLGLYLSRLAVEDVGGKMTAQLDDQVEFGVVLPASKP